MNQIKILLMPNCIYNYILPSYSELASVYTIEKFKTIYECDKASTWIQNQSLTTYLIFDKKLTMFDKTNNFYSKLKNNELSYICNTKNIAIQNKISLPDKLNKNNTIPLSNNIDDEFMIENFDEVNFDSNDETF